MRVKRSGILLTSLEVAEYLGISEKLAKKLMQNNEIISIELEGETLRTTQQQVDLFINELFKKSKKWKYSSL